MALLPGQVDMAQPQGSRNWALSGPQCQGNFTAPSHPLIYKLEPGKGAS